jgi:hypothetical protein
MLDLLLGDFDVMVNWLQNLCKDGNVDPLKYGKYLFVKFINLWNGKDGNDEGDDQSKTRKPAGNIS